MISVLPAPPTGLPTIAPTSSSTVPSVAPTGTPLTVLTDAPSLAPTGTPLVALTDAPSMAPTGTPLTVLTDAPSMAPTGTPLVALTDAPSLASTGTPLTVLTDAPSMAPIDAFTAVPTAVLPIAAISGMPTSLQTQLPSFSILIGRSFFVSNLNPNALDSNNGTASYPWRSIRKVIFLSFPNVCPPNPIFHVQVNDFGSSVGFRPGDTIFLEGYFTDAPIVLSVASSFGTAAQPLRFTSWSSAARATIAYPSQNGFYIYAYGALPLGLGIQIDHLILRGNGQARSNGVATAGILVDFQPKSAANVDTLIIDNVDISGYMYGVTTFRGVVAGFIRDVNITNSVVHDNVEGATSSGKGTYSYIGRSGSGIFLSGVQNALIDSVSAFNNGGSSQQNPVGIGIRDSDTVVIRNCSCSAGGGGFELSSGTTNAVIEDSFSFENGGPGFSVVSESNANLNGAGSCSNVSIQDSTSVADGGISTSYALGVIAGSMGAVSSDILFQNMNITVTATDPPFYQFGNFSSAGFTGLHLSGIFNNVDTRSVDFFFPSSTYSCNLSCSSAQSPVCKLLC